MKKAFFVVLATLVAMSQFGCSWWDFGNTWWQATDLGMQVYQTLRDANVI